MGRLALLNWFLFMFLRPCVSNLAGVGRSRTETLHVCVCASVSECECVLHGNTAECRETLIGQRKGKKKRVRPVACQMFLQKAVAVVLQVQRGVGGREDPGHLASCCSCTPPHAEHHVRLAPFVSKPCLPLDKSTARSLFCGRSQTRRRRLNCSLYLVPSFVT